VYQSNCNSNNKGDGKRDNVNDKGDSKEDNDGKEDNSGNGKVPA
jgi:hypothetical protein